MSLNPFAISLSSDIHVQPTEQGYTFGSPCSGNQLPWMGTISVSTGPGWEDAIALMQAGTATQQGLTQTLSAQEGESAGEALAMTLQQLDQRGWLHYSVLPLAIAIPMVEGARLNLDTPHWTKASVSLSRFAYQRPHDGGMVLGVNSAAVPILVVAQCTNWKFIQ